MANTNAMAEASFNFQAAGRRIVAPTCEDHNQFCEANRANTRCYDRHEELPYLPNQRFDLFSTKKVLLDFIVLCAEGNYLWSRNP
jgi:hypothetical protein